MVEPMTELELESCKRQIINILRDRHAGDCYNLLLELAEESKQIAKYSQVLVSTISTNYQYC